MGFTFDQKILFKHCDPAGIVFYPRYFEIINDVVEAFFDHLGYPFETMHETSGVPTVRIEAAFPAPSRHGDRLTIELRCTRIGGTSLALALTGTVGDEIRLTADLVLVHIDARGRPAPWPDSVRANIEPYLEGGA